MRALGGSPGWPSLGTRSNYQLTLGIRREARRGRRCLFGKIWLGSHTGCFTHWLGDSGQSWQCPLPRAAAGTEAPAASRYPAQGSPRPCRRGRAEPPAEEEAFAGAISAAPDGFRLSLRFHRRGRRGPPRLLATPTRLPAPGPLPSPSPGGQSCSPIVRSPEPGLLGSPSRGAGAGLGACESLTAAFQRSHPSRRRRRLPPWLRRRHLTTEVTHRPLLPGLSRGPAPPGPRPPPASRPPPTACVSSPAAFGLGGHLDDGRKTSGNRPESD